MPPLGDFGSGARSWLWYPGSGGDIALDSAARGLDLAIAAGWDLVAAGTSCNLICAMERTNWTASVRFRWSVGRFGGSGRESGDDTGRVEAGAARRARERHARGERQRFVHLSVAWGCK